MQTKLTLTILAIASTAVALDYPHVTDEPQKTGWPLTAEERAYVVDKPEYERRPGRESNKHLPQLWPQVPSAGFFGGDSWLKIHEGHVKMVQENQGPIDVLLVGDSITIQWGESWKKNFPDLKAVNIGIGGDKTQNVLWRLDHGGVDGLKPKAIVLMIGNNNMFFTPETGIEAAAKGIEICARNLREKFPAAAIVVVKILPAHTPGNAFYEDIKKTNAALELLNLESDAKVRVLDLWGDFTNADGTQKKELFTPDNIHLSPAGYAVYATQLKPLLQAMLNGKPLPAKAVKKAAIIEPAPAPQMPKESSTLTAPKAARSLVLKTKPVLTYPYAPYNDLRLRCPQSQIVLVKLLPAFDPSKEAGKQVVNINALLETLKLDTDSNINVLDLWSSFTNADGTLKSELYSDGHLHLGPAGYEVFAAKLKLMIGKVLQ